MSETEIVSSLIEWEVAAEPMAGQQESGDLHVIQPFPNGVLVGAVDGLGHGDEAAVAARSAASLLEKYAGESVISLFRRCHDGLVSTRGVVMSLASFNALDGTMMWLGVGNVSAILLRADPSQGVQREYLLLRGGVIGYQVPSLRAAVIPVERGDTLVFATDGVKTEFAEALSPGEPPRLLAPRILSGYGRSTDDSLVLAVRWLG